MKRLSLLLFIFFLFPSFLSGQNDSIHILQVHFLYGSKPLKKFKETEKKFFGGIHGGHVSLEIDHEDYGFSPKGKFHILSHSKNLHSAFVIKQTGTTSPYPINAKFATIEIPIEQKQYEQFKIIVKNYATQTPYDYAFIGMRCAASAQDVLGQIGVIEKRKKTKNIRTTFYPKKLRKRLFKLAVEKNYKVSYQDGRKSRKWESD